MAQTGGADMLSGNELEKNLHIELNFFQKVILYTMSMCGKSFLIQYLLLLRR